MNFKLARAKGRDEMNNVGAYVVGGICGGFMFAIGIMLFKMVFHYNLCG